MADILTQKNVYLSLHTALGTDVLILEEFNGIEGFSELYEFKITAYIAHSTSRENNNLAFDKILNKPATVEINYLKKKRYINGIVTACTQNTTVSYAIDDLNRRQERTYYTLTLRPRLWLLTMRYNCRIFQNMSTLDIIQTFFEEYHILCKILTNTQGTTIREFCVQYNESDMAFISRLMEAEGIFYFFDHSAEDHTLIVCDQKTSYSPNILYPTLANVPHASKPSPFQPGLFNLKITQQLVPSAASFKDYNYTVPDAMMLATSKTEGTHLEHYTYPGNYKTLEHGNVRVATQLGALENPIEIYDATTNIPLIHVGKKIKLMGCLRPAANEQEYAVQSIRHHGRQSTIAPVDEAIYTNDIVFQPITLPFYPPITTPRPMIHGSQTAIVTGKEDEEIWTDKYGRILVKFHWDRSKTEHQETSCWIRVAQGWTGKNWGVLFTPRIGQEVVVSFLNGNPDDPLITGCVYNADNIPPYLPDNPTKSTIKTNSSKGGDGFNEFRFEDKKDSEEIYMHAEKDLNIDILNGNRSTILEGAKDDGGNDSLLLKKGNRSMTLNKGNETDLLKEGNRSTTLEKGNDTLTLKEGNRSVTLDKGNQETSITGNNTLKITGDYTIEVGGNLTIKATGAIKMTTATTYDLSVTAAYTMKCMQLTYEAQALMEYKAPMITQESDSMHTLKSGVVTIQAQSAVMIQGEACTVVAEAIALG